MTSTSRYEYRSAHDNLCENIPDGIKKQYDGVTAGDADDAQFKKHNRLLLFMKH